MDSSNFEAKETTEMEVTETTGESASVSSSQHNEKDDWVTGVKKRMPWTGIGSLVFVILTSVGQMLVLLFAERRSASDWPEYITPNVCLSILNGVASLAITFAVVQGIAIAWWRKALLGASIKELHYTWNFSTSITSILLKYKYFNAIALAALMTKVAIIDGVLFQRSIGTYIDISWQEPKPGSIGGDTLFAWSQEDFPVTGMMGATNDSDGEMTADFSNTVINWILTGYGVNTNDYIPSCLGFACVYGLNGTGFAIECQDSSTTDDFVYTAANRSGSSNKTIFDIDFAMKYPDTIKNYSRIEMTALWPVSESGQDGSLKCPTTFTSTTCEFRPSILNYTIFYVNSSTIAKSQMRKDPSKLVLGTETIGSSGSQLSFSCRNASEASWGLQYTDDQDGCGTYNPNLKQLKGVEVLQPLQIYEPWKAGASSKLLGIYNALKDTFRSEAVLVHNNGTWSVSQTGMQAPIDMGNTPQNNTFCNYTYLYPRDEIITRLNLLMAQTSTYYELWPDEMWWSNATNNTIYNQNPKARQYFKDIYYSTDFLYMGVALGLTLFVILCIIPSYWGFWQLGRDVTLGPLEIAYAFQGPAFSAVQNVNGNADAVIKTVGKTRIQYGEVPDGDGKKHAFKIA